MSNGISMTNAVIECILSRRATKYYDPAFILSDDQIRELVRIGTSAPTSFHMQNWRFIAVRTPEAKARLSPIAWNQPPIKDAAVTFIVCGQLANSSVIPERLAPLVEAGIMPEGMVPEWEIPARDLYMNYPQRQRDEAVHTGAIGATAMIYAARSLGLGSTPMIGFDAEAVHREFGLAEDEVPVMLLSIGAERTEIGRRSRAVPWTMCWISYNPTLQPIACGDHMPRAEALKPEQVPAGWVDLNSIRLRRPSPRALGCVRDARVTPKARCTKKDSWERVWASYVQQGQDNLAQA